MRRLSERVGGLAGVYVSCLLFFILSPTPFTPTYADQITGEEPAARYIRGAVSDVNYVGSKITIKWFYSTDMVPSKDKITFHLADNVKILSNKRKIFDGPRQAPLTEIAIGDHVIIRYFGDERSGNLEATNITVMDHDRPIPS